MNEIFIKAKTKAGFLAKLSAGDISNENIVFIEDADQIWAQGKYYSVVPKNGKEGDILAWKADGEAQWASLMSMYTGLEDVLGYGVEIDSTVADPHLVRIGNMSLHKTLPIQSQIKHAIVQGKNLMYWLNESDKRFRKVPVYAEGVTTVIADWAQVEGTEEYTGSLVHSVFGTLQYEDQYIKIGENIYHVTAVDTENNTATVVGPAAPTEESIKIELGSVRNGYDGTVAGLCPSFYIKSTTNGNKSKVMISTVRIDDTWEHQTQDWIGTYRATVLNAVPENMGYLSTLPVNSAVSIVNKHDYCRGGNNNAAYDKYLESDPCRCQLGKPRTKASRSTMRSWCRNAGLEMLNYNQYKNFFYWLWVIEYANFNCQEAFNSALTEDGYRQGGMGAGVTTWSGEWNAYNGYYPIVPCGYMDEFGNGTAIKAISTVAGTNNLDAGKTAVAAKSFDSFCWRGFENTFGDIWTNIEGIVLLSPAAGQPSDVYVTSNPQYYDDTINNKEIVGKEIAQDGYTKAWTLGDGAHIIPMVMGGDTTKYICDYHWCNADSTERRTLFVGGGANYGGYAGLGFFYSYLRVSYAFAYIGFRPAVVGAAGVDE